MKKYICVKFVEAEPMTDHDASEVINNPMAVSEIPIDGYLVDYGNGYKSWRPKEQFESANRPCGGMPFGHAIEAAKQGKKIARAGWNGKGMFVYVVGANSYPAQTGVAKEHFGENAMVPYNAYMALKGVDGYVSTWVPSSTDTLADDWEVVE